MQKKETVQSKNAKYNFKSHKIVNDPENAPKLLVGTGKDDKYLCVVLTADRGLVWWV